MFRFPPVMRRAAPHSRLRPSVRPLVAVAAGVTLYMAAPALADEIGTMAKRLAELRGQVESMSDELSARKNELQEQLRSYARQKAEIELEIQRDDTRLAKTRQAVAQKQAEVEALKSQNQALGPTFDKQVGAVRAYVAQSLPFRTKERLAELDKLSEQVKSGLLTPPRALNRLWGFMEDELRMTRESGLFSQPVIVEGKEQLADVVRLGMVMLYYRTPDEKFGSTVRDNNGAWQFRTIEGDAERKQVRTLFDTFKKQIRTGYFELPSALPGMPKQ